MRVRFGSRYRVDLDLATTSWKDPWMHTMPTRTGTVFVHSPTHAGVEINAKHWSVIRKLEATGYPIHIRGDDLTTFLVPWAYLKGELPLLQPYRAKRLNPTDRARKISQVSPHNFRPPVNVPQRTQEARKSPKAARGSSKPQRAF
jgi:hypothetical protein